MSCSNNSCSTKHCSTEFNLQKTEQDHRQLVRCLVVHSQYASVFQSSSKKTGRFTARCAQALSLLLQSYCTFAPPTQTNTRERKKHISNTFRMEAPGGNFWICSNSVEVGSVTVSNPHVILPKHSLWKKMFLVKYHLHVPPPPFASQQRDTRPELIDVKSVHKRLTGIENRGPAAVRHC